MDAPISSHRINRRRLVTGLGVTALATSRIDAARAQDEAWRPEDGLRLAGPVAGLETLDPALTRDMPTNFVIRQLCRGLMGYDEELLPVPELAASVDVSADQTEYTFTLRADARFHDGRAVEADDVAWSFARALHPATSRSAGLPLSGTMFLGDIAGADEVRNGDADRLSGVDIIDARTLRITLEAPSTTFLMRLAAVPASIVDRHQDTTSPGWWTSLNGSGPYRIESVDPSAELVVRATDTWRSEAIPVAKAWIRLGLPASAPENLLQNGDIDLVDNANAGMVPLLLDPATGLGGYQLYEGPQFALSYVAFGGNREPLDDIHIRKAIQLGFDVPGYVGALLAGAAMAPEGVIPQGVLGRAWRISMPVSDLDAARAEIAASRYGSAENVPPIRIQAADVAPVQALRDSLMRDLGLRIEAVQVNWGDFLSGLSARMWDAYSVFWGMDYPDPESLLWMLWSSGSVDNYTGYWNDGFDALLAESRIVADDITRRDLYMEAQKMLIDDVAVIPLYVPRRFTIARPGFEHLPVTATGLLGLERVR